MHSCGKQSVISLPLSSLSPCLCHSVSQSSSHCKPCGVCGGSVCGSGVPVSLAEGLCWSLFYSDFREILPPLQLPLAFSSGLGLLMKTLFTLLLTLTLTARCMAPVSGHDCSPNLLRPPLTYHALYPSLAISELFQLQLWAQAPAFIPPQPGPKVLGDCRGSLLPNTRPSLPP